MSTYVLLPLVDMTLLLRLLLLLWFVIGSGFGNVFLMTMKLEKGSFEYFQVFTLAECPSELPLQVCPPHLPAQSKPAKQKTSSHHQLVGLNTNSNILTSQVHRRLKCKEHPMVTPYTCCCQATVTINPSHISPQLKEAPCFCFPSKSENDQLIPYFPQRGEAPCFCLPIK